MKRFLPLILIMPFIAVHGCKKKSNQAGSTYTKQIAGKRSFLMTHTFYLGAQTTVLSTDTEQLDIQYINDGTIKIDSTVLNFAPNAYGSNDSEIVFEYLISPNASNNYETIRSVLSYYPFANTIFYGIYTRVSAQGGGSTTYQSL